MSLKLIVISPPIIHSEEVLQVYRLIESGLKKYHIRKPGISKKELERYILSFSKKYRRKLVLHSHYSLAKKYDLGGIHLTENTRRKKLPASFNAKRHSLSASFHKIAEAEKRADRYDYIFLSPVFDSISKAGYTARFKEAELIELNKKHKNIFALGGVTPSTISKLSKLGFRGVASLGYIWEGKDPVRNYKRLVLKIK